MFVFSSGLKHEKKHESLFKCVLNLHFIEESSVAANNDNFYSYIYVRNKL
jgi:hypothetical protein